MKLYMVTWVGQGDKLKVQEIKEGKDNMSCFTGFTHVFWIHGYTELAAVRKAHEMYSHAISQ
jgi:hypothetical protein